MSGTAAISLGSITTTELADATVVHLAGAIDAALRAEAGAAMSRSLERRLPIVLDTSDVTFMDSTGLAFLILCSRFGQEEGLPVTLPHPPLGLAMLMQTTGVDVLFR